MKRIFVGTMLALAVFGMRAAFLRAELPQVYAWRQAQVLPWHNGYYDPYWGEPIALVVPPNAEFQANYGWGVGGTRVSPIYHQFARPFPGFYGPGPAPGRFIPTPNQPSDTLEFGVYYVRGPW